MPYPSMSVFLVCTGLVVLAGSIIIPIWWKFDPLLESMSMLNYMHNGISPKEVLFTKDELSAFKASTSSGKIYIGILGQVYDVSGGKRHYGKDGSYSFFTGVDGSRAFVTGDFNKVGLIDDIEGLTDEECLSLSDWVKFYSTDYKYVGNVIGNFYDQNGKETAALKEFHVKVAGALKLKELDNKDKIVFPDCNSSWSKAEGTVLSCSDQSGGLKRDWVGVPRMFFKPGQSEHRCACVNEKNLNDSRLREYPGCSKTSVSCELK